MIPVRKCDTPVIKDEIPLPRSASSLGKAECARHRAMPQLSGSRRSYDHRIKQIVCETGNPRIFRHLRIPRSTTASWLSRGRPSVVSLDWNRDMASVLDENEKLRHRAEWRTAIIRLLVVLLKLSGFRLDEQRLPDGKAKARSYSSCSWNGAKVPARSCSRASGSIAGMMPCCSTKLT